MNPAHAVLFLEFLKPLVDACAVLLTFSVGIYAITRRRSASLLLVAIASFITTFVDGVYFSGALQTEWKITLFPVEIRRVLFLIAELLFIVEVFLWPLALFLLLRERDVASVGRSSNQALESTATRR